MSLNNSFLVLRESSEDVVRVWLSQQGLWIPRSQGLGVMKGGPGSTRPPDLRVQHTLPWRLDLSLFNLLAQGPLQIIIAI